MVISMLMAVALQAAAPADPRPGVLVMLEGEWVCRLERQRIGPAWRSETWRRDDAGRLTGTIETHRTTAGPPQRNQEAELVISGRGRATRLTYRADGRTTRYRLVRDDRTGLVFQSIGDGSPRIISYRYGTGFRQLEVMHGLADGSSRRWLYRPGGMRSAPPTCDGGRS